MKSILVTGTRAPLWDEQKMFVRRNLERVYARGDRFILGDAKGVDALVQAWCNCNDVPCQVFRAEWSRYGKSAGPKRNQRMINELAHHVDCGRSPFVLAFPGPRSTGTYDCAHRARTAGFEVEVRNV